MPILQAPLNSGVTPVVTQVSDAVSTTSAAQPITFASKPLPAPSSVVVTGTSTTYAVQSGDTLLSIALQYGVTISDILVANTIHRTSILRLGENLVIPTATSSTQ